MNETCDVCGFLDESKTNSVVHECKDGVYRCKLCRQKAVYGRTFSHDDDEYNAWRRNEGNQDRNIKS